MSNFNMDAALNGAVWGFVIAGMPSLILMGIISWRFGLLYRGIYFMIGAMVMGTLFGIIGIIPAWVLFGIMLRKWIKKTSHLTSNELDELRKLKELKENGTLTEEEFKNEKSKIINKAA